MKTVQKKDQPSCCAAISKNVLVDLIYNNA